MSSESIKIDKNYLQTVANYELPAWQDLPERLLSRAMQDFINDELGKIFQEEKLITGYMLQNYLKWEFLPQVEGRTYSREHLAWSICITLLKRVLKLENVKDGILMQNKLMTIEESYEVLRRELSRAFKQVFQPVCDGKWTNSLIFSDESVSVDSLAVASICRALAWQLLTEVILKEKGVENLLTFGRE